MSAKKGPLRVGDTRTSQLMYAHGAGGILDLPHFSVLVMGLEDWHLGPTIHEPRLLAAVQKYLPAVKHLRLPPPAPNHVPQEFAGFAPKGVPVRTFPGWLSCSRCNLLGLADGGLFTFRRNPVNPAKNLYVHENCPQNKIRRAPTANPVRFLTACPKGHLDEFPFHWFLHRGSQCNGHLRLIDMGLIGDFGAVRLTCDACGAASFMTDAFGERGAATMPQCRGLSPHLQRFDEEGCTHQLKTITVGSSNMWFPVKRSVLSLPTKEETDALTAELAVLWETVAPIATLAELETVMKYVPAFGNLKHLMERQRLSLDAVWNAIQKRKNQTQSHETDPTDLAVPEWDLLSSITDHARHTDFDALAERVPAKYQRLIERVVLLERLREVTVLTGFTRLDALDKFAGDEEQEHIRCAPLSKGNRCDWLPAAETRGEGIFIQFNEALLTAWAHGNAVRKRERAFRNAHFRWRDLLGYEDPTANFPGIRYVALHSFAHLLMRRMALECGYNLSALKEKVYSDDGRESGTPMAGVLIYTAQTDSEGSLGGLVALGRETRLAGLLDQALEQGRLCSADPLCAEHQPTTTVPIHRHGACCHACLFLVSLPTTPSG